MIKSLSSIKDIESKEKSKEENREETERKENRKLFQTNTRVIYADTDKMGIVYHARYLNYFEVGRNEMLREIGLSYKSLESQEIYLPIIQVEVNFHKPAFYDDFLTVKTFLGEASLKLVRFRVNCLIYREKELLASGFTQHIFSDRTGRPLRVKKSIREELFRKLVCQKTQNVS